MMAAPPDRRAAYTLEWGEPPDAPVAQRGAQSGGPGDHVSEAPNGTITAILTLQDSVDQLTCQIRCIPRSTR
jgi:hypothetical protein